MSDPTPLTTLARLRERLQARRIPLDPDISVDRSPDAIIHALKIPGDPSLHLRATTASTTTGPTGRARSPIEVAIEARRDNLTIWELGIVLIGPEQSTVDALADMIAGLTASRSSVAAMPIIRVADATGDLHHLDKPLTMHAIDHIDIHQGIVTISNRNQLASETFIVGFPGGSGGAGVVTGPETPS